MARPPSTAPAPTDAAGYMREYRGIQAALFDLDTVAAELRLT